MTFYDCVSCDMPLMKYSEFTNECIVINTDRGLKCICVDCDSQKVKEKFSRVRCEASNKDGNQCSYDANNVKPYRCARHGGGKTNEY